MPEMPLPESGPPSGMQKDFALQGGALGGDIFHLLWKIDDGVLFLGRNWQITYANKSARDITRLSRDDIENKTHWEIFPETKGTELERKFRAAMEERIADQATFHFERFNLWLDISIVPVETGIGLIYRDVTERMLQVLNRRTLIEEAEQVLDLTSDAICYLDREYRFTYLNRRARELFSPEGDVVGDCIWDRFPSAFHEGSVYVEKFKLSMEEKLPCEFESYYPEPLNKWFCIESRPTQSGIIVFLRDATKAHSELEQLRLEREEAERQRVEIETIYRTAPIALALIDAVTFQVLQLNDRYAGFFDLPSEELRGKRITDMMPATRLAEILASVARGDAVNDCLIQGELANVRGQQRSWMVNFSPVFGGAKNVWAISIASIDITRQKRAEAALIQSEKIAAVGKLAASVSHEINNPLEAMTNLLYLVATDPTLPPQLREYMKLAQGELSRVSQIATQTLRFHRQSMRPSMVDATRLISDVINLYQGRLANAGITAETRCETITPFLCFENDVRQVLNNLIGNAIDAMAGGGRLLIRTRDVSGYGMKGDAAGQRGIRITIADNGHGMSSVTKERVFEPFYTTKDLLGTGLGLWICSEIVERHGGRLILRSSQHELHHGTVFSLFLPVTLRGEVQVRLSA